VKTVKSLIINQKFRDVIPPLSAEEYTSLRESLISEGCRDAIIVWNGVIVDGYHRHAICTELNIPFNISEMPFGNEDAAIEWILRNQVSRRNLSDVERGRLTLKLKALIAARAKDNQRMAAEATNTGSPILAEACESIDTREELAKMAGISHGTLGKIETVDREAPVIISDAMGKIISINKAALLTNRLKGVPEAEREAEARAMLQVEFERKWDRVCREEIICKKINNIVSAAIKDYEYISEDCVEIYARRFPLPVPDIVEGIDTEIKWLIKLKGMFLRRERGQKEKGGQESYE